MQLRRRAPFVVAVVVATLGVGLNQGLLASRAVEPEATSSTIEAARAWREEHGLRSDLLYVQQSLTDSIAFPDTEWAYPLSPDEIAEQGRRARIQEGKIPAVEFASRQPGFAGVYTDNRRGGILTFLFANEAPPIDDLRLLAPAGADVELRMVDRTYGQLQAIKSAILAAREPLALAGVEINTVGIRPPVNAVIVGLGTRSTAVESRLQAEFGPGLAFRAVGRGQSDACTSNQNCWPPKGGFDISWRDDPQATNAYCTSGWIVKRTDQATVRQIMTAGHCLEVAGGVNAWWEHNQGGPDIGQAQANTWTGTGTHLSDVGLLGIQPSAVPTTKNQFIAGTSGGLPIVAAVDTYYLSSSQNVGDHVCRYGLTSLRDCGYISDEDVAHISCIGPNDTNCKTITRTWEVDFDSQGGDSGGPIFLYHVVPQSVHIAFGTHVHSTLGYVPTNPGWYSPYEIGRNEWQALTGKQFNICLSASCP